MFIPQNCLGQFKTHKPEVYHQLLPATVVSTVDYDEFRQIEVLFSDGGTSIPVRMLEHGVSHKPCEGDWVLIGFVKGHKNQPYFAGYYRGNYLWTNHVIMRRDETTEEILIQLPVLPAEKVVDLEEYLSDDSKKKTRAYVHLHTDFAEMSFPVSTSARVFLKADKAGNLTITAPGSITINGATVNVNGSSSVNINGGTINLNK